MKLLVCEMSLRNLQTLFFIDLQERGPAVSRFTGLTGIYTNAIINVAQLPLSCLHEMATLNISVLHGYRNPPVTNLTFNFHYIDKHHRGKVVGKFGVGTRFTSFVYFTSFQLFKNVIYNTINILSLTFVWILLTPGESTILHIWAVFKRKSFSTTCVSSISCHR